MNPVTETCFVPDIINKLLEFFNSCKSISPIEKENIELYEYSMDVLFINESGETDIPSSPVDMEGYECNSLGNNMTVVRKVSYDGSIKLLLTFEYAYFGDTHHLVDGTVYFGKKKFTVTEFTLQRNLTIGEKTYDYITKCVFK
jgi:hypothetical protein